MLFGVFVKVRICVKSTKACFVVVFYSGDNFLTKMVAICVFQFIIFKNKSQQFSWRALIKIFLPALKILERLFLSRFIHTAAGSSFTPSNIILRHQPASAMRSLKKILTCKKISKLHIQRNKHKYLPVSMLHPAETFNRSNVKTSTWLFKKNHLCGICHLQSSSFCKKEHDM